MNLGDVNLYTFPSNILEFFPPLPKKTNQNKPRQNKTNKKQTKPKKKKKPLQIERRISLKQIWKTHTEAHKEKKTCL